MPLPPDTRLGLHRVVSPLGAGGMGEVFRATDPKLGRDVAIAEALEEAHEHGVVNRDQGLFRSPDAGMTVIKVPVKPHSYRAFQKE